MARHCTAHRPVSMSVVQAPKHALCGRFRRLRFRWKLVNTGQHELVGPLMCLPFGDHGNCDTIQPSSRRVLRDFSSHRQAMRRIAYDTCVKSPDATYVLFLGRHLCIMMTVSTATRRRWYFSSIAMLLLFDVAQGHAFFAFGVLRAFG
jgi:hypothetical protein